MENRQHVWLVNLTVPIAAVILYLLSIGIAAAEVRTINATGEYRMGDNDTRTDAKRLALLDAKHLALEKTGTYIESITEVKNFDISKEEIRAYTAGIVEMVEQATKDIMEGNTHIISVEVTARIDTDVVARQIDALRKNETAKAELMRLRTDSDRLRREVEANTRELMALKSKNKVEEVTKQRQQLIIRAFVNELVEQASVTYTFEFLQLLFNAPAAGKPVYQRSALTALTRAKNLTEQALSLDPTNAVAEDIMTRILLDEGDYLVETTSYETAIGKFRTALQFQPNNAYVHSRFANALSKMGDLEGALAEQRAAITLRPGDAMYRIGLGQLLLKKGEDDSAITEYRKAIPLNPAGGLAHMALGQALLRKGLKVEGEREVEEGIRLMKENLRKCEEEEVRSGKISVCSPDTGPVPGTSIPRSLGPIR